MDEVGRDFDEFVTASSPSLLRTAYLLTGDHGHAEDALQHALMATARHWHTIRTDPVAYTRRAVVNLAKNRWRARSRRVVEVSNSTEPSYEPPDHAVALSQALVGALRQVPYQQRTVLVLRYFEDLSIEQTAEVLGCSAGTVKSQSHHGLAKLRELIGDPADFEEITDAHR
jgi:RNA polymerase sigma-70 factor (sigma-E family)